MMINIHTIFNLYDIISNPLPSVEEAEKVEAKPDRKRCWEAWSDGETTLFFEAVNEVKKLVNNNFRFI